MSASLQSQSAAAIPAESQAKSAAAEIRGGERFYRPELDVLRFFAFLAVFFCHLKPHAVPPPFTYLAKTSVFPQLVRLGKDVFVAGSLGVDLFFVLSAYLITELLVREKSQRGVLNVRAFYVRRILRIWPLYFFFIGLAYVLQRFIPGQVFTWQDVVAFLLLSGNWVLALRWLLESVAGPLWSVSVEEQFYLLWPQVVRRASAARMTSIAIGLLVMASSVRLVLVTVHAAGAVFEFSTITRLDGIALGILLSSLLRGRIPQPRIVWRVLLLASGCLALLLAADIMPWAHNPPTFPVLGGVSVYLVGAVGGMCLLLSILGLPLEDWLLVRRLRLVYLGKISYGLYVYHYLALFLARGVLGTLRPALYVPYVLLSLAFTIAMASVSYRFLERPFLNLKRQFTYVMSRPD